MKLLGCDPGIHGGIAIVEVGVNGKALLLSAIDVPTVGSAAKEVVDVLNLIGWISKHSLAHAFIERAQAFPKQGLSSSYKYGRAYGALEASILSCRVPLTIIEPSMWKKFHRLKGNDKESSRQRAIQLFPDAHEMLARKRDHGRAEAALIALAGWGA